jgi:hypothetical protein
MEKLMQTLFEAKKSSKSNRSWNHSMPQAYLIPDLGIIIKVEKRHHNSYVAHYPEGAEVIIRRVLDGWECQGRWIETAAVAVS